MVRKALVLIALAAAIVSVGGAAWADALTTEETQSLRDSLRECWTLPVGASELNDAPIQIEVTLNADGTLEGPPGLVSDMQARGPGVTGVIESALRAIYDCAPFDLPAEKHRSWEHIRITFDPRAPATCLGCLSCHVYVRAGCDPTKGFVQLSFQGAAGF